MKPAISFESWCIANKGALLGVSRVSALALFLRVWCRSKLVYFTCWYDKINS